MVAFYGRRKPRQNIVKFSQFDEEFTRFDVEVL